MIKLSDLARRAGAIAAVALALAANASAADYTMRISHHWLPTLATAKNIKQFAAEVRQTTNGKVDVQIFPAAQLFKPNQEHGAVATGKVEAAVMLDFTMAGAVPELNLTLIPYVFADVEKLKKFLNSEAATILDAKLRQKGLTKIAWIVESIGGMFTAQSKPLNKPEDFKGVKIRGLSKLFDASLIAMGAAPAAMSGSEIYQALQTGVIDATITSPHTATNRKIYEVQKYGTLSHSGMANAMLVVNPAWWQGLPADLRQSIQAAAQKAEQRSLPTSNDIDPEAVKALREKGMIITVMTPPQEKAMAEVMQPPVMTLYKAIGPDAVKLLDIVRKL